ncbi:hypothetical protein DS2_00435 [Catenovulum agarivorans DS-2]|uniref:DNA repair ATPase n=1 Tax=Catenovulum agarivorans DS-2 TaxID=1328313 RepID=W7QGT0_9ALTE|nr:hypothetical protein [Catenovulum agarivorans]EWH12144.1 hypothetical protein DS2_00435 [Catenovulum agarivorans DS-2]
MIFSIVIALVVALVVLAIVINAVQQHKEKVEAEKRNEIAKYKAVIEDTESLLMNIGNIPVSNQLVLVLHQRVLDAVKNMYELMPESNELKQRVRDAQGRVQSMDPNEKVQSEDSFALPDDERATIALLQSIKKLRSALRAEHSKGKVDTHLFMNEDKRLDRLQLRINVESLMNRGQSARQGQMLGSARQYFEKALSTITSQPVRDDYINQRKAELEKTLAEINEELKNSNARDRIKKQAEEKDDLDMLFQPKKKW